MRPKIRRFDDEDVFESESDDEPSSKKALPAETVGSGDRKVEGVTAETPDENEQNFEGGPVYIESPERYQERLQRLIDAKENRLFAFLANPELAVQIFFSSYFRDGGMLWWVSSGSNEARL